MTYLPTTDRLMTVQIRPLVASMALMLLGAACGDMPEAEVDSAEVRRAEYRRAQKSLDLERGLDFEHATPVLKSVHRCPGCENLRILHVKAAADDEDDDQHKKARGRDSVGEAADGNPVPFPVDEKNPYLD